MSARECVACKGTGTVGDRGRWSDMGHQVPCDATGEDDEGHWYCEDGTVTLFGCPKCGTVDDGRFSDGEMVCDDCQFGGKR